MLLALKRRTSRNLIKSQKLMEECHVQKITAALANTDDNMDSEEGEVPIENRGRNQEKAEVNTEQPKPKPPTVVVRNRTWPELFNC
ncbi:hypothetical protein JTB14_014268 [Gonioctena quinquepunctata]|nr:hypothetical protein JTB14_014268 [Gonioctena quinquepunctata]